MPAHEGSTQHELMFHILHGDPRPLRELCTTPIELERVVMRALSRDSRERPASADELARALAPFGPIAPGAVRIENTNDDTMSDAAVTARVSPWQKVDPRSGMPLPPAQWPSSPGSRRLLRCANPNPA